MLNTLPSRTREACPLCAGPESSCVHSFGELSARRCVDCGFMFASPVYSGSEISALYTDGYTSLRHERGQRVNASINSRVLASLPVRGEASHLDVGSGFGFLLAAMRRRGWTVTGVELSRAERMHANHQLGVETYASVQDLPADAKFDVVTAFEVIEHIEDPRPFLQDMARRVRDGGWLVLATDNFQSRVVTTLGRGFTKWIPHEHISYFAPETLTRLVEEMDGLRVVKTLSYTPWEYDLRGLLAKLTRGRVGGRVFDLADELGSDDAGDFRFYTLRRLLNSTWAHLSMSRSLDGEMMFVIARMERP